MRMKNKRRTRRPHKRGVRIAVQYACPAAGAPSAARLRVFARAAACTAAEITVRVVGAAEARRLNRAYRGTDHATNVLTFHGGDIVLCHPVVVREAQRRGKTVAAHYAHLVVHGMLHLRGYAHERAREARRMETREAAILAQLGYGDPYSLRG